MKLKALATECHYEGATFWVLPDATVRTTIIYNKVKGTLGIEPDTGNGTHPLDDSAFVFAVLESCFVDHDIPQDCHEDLHNLRFYLTEHPSDIGDKWDAFADIAKAATINTIALLWRMARERSTASVTDIEKKMTPAPTN